MKSYWRWLWLLLPLLAGLGLARLKFDAEVLNVLPPQNPAVQGLKLHQQHFANARELFIVLQAGDAVAAANAAQSLAQALRQQRGFVERVLWQSPWQESPAQMGELIAFAWRNQPPETFAELLLRFEPDNLQKAFGAARERLATSLSPEEIARAGYDPLGVTEILAPLSSSAGGLEGADAFASPDGTLRIITVKARGGLAGYRECVTWMAAVKTCVEEWRASAHPVGLGSVRFTGRPAFMAEIGGGMERDLAGPGLGTLAVIALLFYLTHRRWRPMLWLIFLLLLILAGTLTLGGFLLGAINVVSLGFAAILLGLAEDFGIVMYQESRAHPALSFAEIKRRARPGIYWSALTTAAAFLLLNLSGIPGLGQLGTLVAIGIFLSAILMVHVYLPPLMRLKEHGGQEQPATRNEAKPAGQPHSGMVTTAAMLFLMGSLAMLAIAGWPAFNRSPEALRPQASEAYSALDDIKKNLGQAREPLWLVIRGQSAAETTRLGQVALVELARLSANRLIAGYTLPLALVPGDNHLRNLKFPPPISQAKLHDVAAANGFSTNSVALAAAVLEALHDPQENAVLIRWPMFPASQWVMDQFVAHTDHELFLFGLIHPAANVETVAANWRADRHTGILLTSWEMLGWSLSQTVLAELKYILAAVGAVVVLTLWLAFRRGLDVLLSLLTLGASLVCLLGLMRLFGWSWNMMNLVALPLLLGIGVDFSIHIQLALRRYQGDLSATHHVVGKALLLAGATTVAGFASLAFSSNTGLASLGRICAAGIVCCQLTAIYLLPVCWAFFNLKPAAAHLPGLYSRTGWRAGMWAVRYLPLKVQNLLAVIFGNLCWALAAKRRHAVYQNLLPACDLDSRQARRASRALFCQFARKLADLWRFESGQPMDHLFTELHGWENITTAAGRKRGVLLVTPHLGNWELGGLLMIQRGQSLKIITIAEPDGGLTELRQGARTRWGIETLVIGNGSFAFIEIIKQLEAGASVALLIDRPPPERAVAVPLFGKPFRASAAAAELARASGCALVPTVIVNTFKGYHAYALPEIKYDQAALRNPDARAELTTRLLQAFEPFLRQYADQWYHFVPIWPENPNPQPRNSS